MEKKIRIDFIRVLEDKVTVELNCSPEFIENVRIVHNENGLVVYPVKKFRRADLRDCECVEYIFVFAVEDGRYYFEYEQDAKWLQTKNLFFGSFCSIGMENRNGYYMNDSIAISTDGRSICIERCDFISRIKYKIKWLLELLLKSNASRKALFIRFASLVLKVTSARPVWVIHDRYDQGDDNGEVFWNWLISNKEREIRSYFVVQKNSPVYNRIGSHRYCLIVDSLKYRIVLLAAECIIDSAGYSELKKYTNFYRDICADIKYIFLQHGVIYNDISPFMSRYERNFSSVVTSAYRETQHIVKTTGYYYEKKDIWLIGMPRFDRLYHNEKKVITIMPSWRMYCNNLSSEEFCLCDYYMKWMNLLTSHDLQDIVGKMGYSIQFKIHPNFARFSDLFRGTSCLVVNVEKTYQQIFAESNLIITDYSSAVFDFLYLQKPVIYYQFDKKDFYGGKHTTQKGYLDLEREGFGYIVEKQDDLVNIVNKYLQNGCKIEDVYRKRVELFFAFHDHENCNRLYNKLIDM